MSALRGRVVEVSERKTYDVRTWREEGFWVIDIDELGLTTQARRLDQVEYMARDAIALWLDAAEESFDVAVQRRIPEEIASRVGHLSEARERASRAQAEAAAEARELARSLHEAGYPMRDIGELLGVSYQRAQQLSTPPRAS